MRRLLAVLVAVVVMLASAPWAVATPGDPYAPQYYFDQWHVTDLWASGARGQGVTIGEIDTGVDADLPAFAGRVLVGKDFGRLGGDGRIDRDKEAYAHGTAMASIMVGRPSQYDIQGLAPGAKVLPVAIPLNGTTDAASDDRLAQAIRWTADHGAKIISMSLGGVRRPSPHGTACPADEQSAIFHALRKGALVLAAGGNRGEKGNAIEEPGVCLGVVSVGAVDSAGKVAGFSSRHRYLTLTAPGVNIPSIGHGGVTFSGDGTSQATAIASAAAALVWSRYPTLTASQLLSRLLASADRHGDAHDSSYGYGTINPERAVDATVPLSASNPVFGLAAPFMQRNAAAGARAALVKPPAAVKYAAKPPGTYSVGKAVTAVSPRVLAGLWVALAGLLVLFVLGVMALGARRRRRPVPAPPSPEPWPPAPPA